VQQKQDSPVNGRFVSGDKLAQILDLDMNAWFTPTAENYFSRISKSQILAALAEARNQPPAPAWEKLKKSDLAQIAEREISGSNWSPKILR
jgi:ParB family chromosome partitioning protein